MTAVTFADAMDVNYTTVMRWLRNGLVSGAELIEPVPGMKVW
jgi:predicted site-specific integrase-resolvase